MSLSWCECVCVAVCLGGLSLNHNPQTLPVWIYICTNDVVWRCRFASWESAVFLVICWFACAHHLFISDILSYNFWTGWHSVACFVLKIWCYARYKKNYLLYYLNVESLYNFNSGADIQLMLLVTGCDSTIRRLWWQSGSYMGHFFWNSLGQ